MRVRIIVLVGALLLILALGWFNRARSAELPVVCTAPPAPAHVLTHAQETWRAVLNWCESRGNDAAINHRDLDGTPSYGRYQFKIGTFASYAKLLELASTTDVMNGDAQDQIVTYMILDPKTDWHHQFPDCVDKYGKPPSPVLP